MHCSPPERPQRPLSTPHLRAVVAPQTAMRHSRTQADFIETQFSAEHSHKRQEKSEQLKQVCLMIDSQYLIRNYIQFLV